MQVPLGATAPHTGNPAMPVMAAPCLQLRVVGGPDAGGVRVLEHGRVRIGRSRGDVRLNDPDVSRQHAELTITGSGVTIRDLGSTNGTTVDGRPVGADPRPLRPGAVLRIGESRLTLVVDEGSRASVTPDGNGNLTVNRPPRLDPPAPSADLSLPTPPPGRQASGFPVAATLLPLVVAAPMAFQLGPQMLTLLLLSPLMLAGGYVGERMSARRRHLRATTRYAQDLATAWAGIEQALVAEERWRRAAAPDPAALLLTALGPRPRLWERRPGDDDFLSLRLGTADLPSRVRVRPPPAEMGGYHPPPVASDVPVSVSLARSGVVGVAGTRHRVESLARSLVAQVAGLHSPRDVSLVLLCSPETAAAWRWLRALPHLRPAWGQDCALLVGLDEGQVAARVAELARVLGERLTGRQGGGGPGRHTVVVLDGVRRLRTIPGVAELLRDGPAAGIHTLCLAGDRTALPLECGATVVVHGEAGTRLRVSVRGEQPVPDAVADLVSQGWADVFAAALAPLREDATEKSGETALPAAVHLAELVGLNPPTWQAIAARWQEGRPSTSAVIGAGADGAFAVDLQVDGPHALVAGTTGAGKSELLQTLIASLAMSNPPDVMCFVLVDYKGGAAFGECAGLPHTVGLVTDLDPQLTARALRSLDAELRRRERLLHDAASKDIHDYLRAGSPRGPLARLVIVIDEFASLAEELPDFVAGLVDIARRGRSLGIHLVLATQRPAGVVNADIRANTNLRIALRVTDPAESQDVIGSAQAALISPATPGRAYLSAGGASPTPFQSASVSCGRRPAVDGDIPAAALPWEAVGDPAPRRNHGSEDGPTDLARLVAAAAQAAAQLRVAARPSPWLPPLPERIDVAVLPTLPPVPQALPIGLIDVPVAQRREVLTVSLEGGHWMVAGGPRSGRSSLLRTLAGVVARDHDAGNVHVYGLDCAGGALPPLVALPHCGAVATRDQPERGGRIISRLLAEVRRRQELLGRAGFGSVAEQRASVPVEERLPWLLLLLDGWEGFLATYESQEHGRTVDLLFTLLREGVAAGLCAVLTGDRSLLTSRIGSVVGRRLLLPMSDPMDFGLASVPPREVPRRMPPGRAVLPTTDGPYETQLALLDTDPAGPAQLVALQRLAAQARDRQGAKPRGPRPFRVEQLPSLVPLAEILPAAQRQAAGYGRLWTLVGLGGDEMRPVGVDAGAVGSAFLVAGPPGSGRSTALAGMARWFAVRGVPVVLVTGRPGHGQPLDGLAGEPGVAGPYRPGQAVELATLLDSTPEGPLAVLVDDAELLLDSPAESPLLDLVRRGPADQRAVVVAGSADRIAVTYRGLTAEARSGRCGLLLSPTGPADGDLLGVRTSAAAELLPGRGFLAVRGVATPVQVPLP